MGGSSASVRPTSGEHSSSKSNFKSSFVLSRSHTSKETEGSGLIDGLMPQKREFISVSQESQDSRFPNDLSRVMKPLLTLCALHVVWANQRDGIPTG